MRDTTVEKLKGLAAGAVSGVIADVLTHPLSTVKTRLQCQGAATSGNIVGERYGGFFPGLKVVWSFYLHMFCLIALCTYSI